VCHDVAAHRDYRIHLPLFSIGVYMSGSTVSDAAPVLANTKAENRGDAGSKMGNNIRMSWRYAYMLDDNSVKCILA